MNIKESYESLDNLESSLKELSESYGIDYYELGRLAGQQAIDILEGKSVPADMPIAYLPAEQCALTVNTTAASQLGITIPQELLDKAEIVE